MQILEDWYLHMEKEINGVIYLRYPATEYLKVAEILTRFLKEKHDSIQGKFVVITHKKIRIKDI